DGSCLIHPPRERGDGTLTRESSNVVSCATQQRPRAHAVVPSRPIFRGHELLPERAVRRGADGLPLATSSPASRIRTPTTALGGCRRSRFDRGQNRPWSLLSGCLLDGKLTRSHASTQAVAPAIHAERE